MKVKSVNIDVYGDRYDPVYDATISFNMVNLQDMGRLSDTQSILEAKASMIDEMIEQINELRNRKEDLGKCKTHNTPIIFSSSCGKICPKCKQENAKEKR